MIYSHTWGLGTMKIALITDDNAGFSLGEIKKLNLHIIKMPVIINGETRFQGENLEEEEFFKLLESNADVKTSQPAPGQLIEMREELLKTYDQVIQIPMSSGLSEECNNAKSLATSYPGKVFIVDNHRISVTLKDSVYDAIKLINEGKTAEEIVKILESEAHNSSIYIMVDTLKYLKRGGRVTPAGAALGGALHIKPVLSIFGEKLDAYKKALGTKKAKQIMFEAIENDLNTKFKDVPRENLMFDVAYSHNLEEALEFRKEFVARFNLDPEKVKADALSLSISTHVGPGILAVALSKIL